MAPSFFNAAITGAVILSRGFVKKGRCAICPKYSRRRDQMPLKLKVSARHSDNKPSWISKPIADHGCGYCSETLLLQGIGLEYVRPSVFPGIIGDSRAALLFLCKLRVDIFYKNSDEFRVKLAAGFILNLFDRLIKTHRQPVRRFAYH